MKARKLIFSVLPLFVAGMLSSCSSDKSPDVTDNIRKSLDQAGFKDVSVSEDRDKGVVTLTGTVPTDTDKQQAESIAKSTAPNLVVADQIAVRPPGNESEAKAVDSDLDKAIEQYPSHQSARRNVRLRRVRRSFGCSPSLSARSPW